MGIQLNIGNIDIRNVDSFSWSSYWTTRTITGLSATVNSDTQVTLNWTNNGLEDYTGHKTYISTDGITYTLNKTVATVETSMVITGLTLGTLYYVKVAPYKGSNIGTLSSAVTATTTQITLNLLRYYNFDELSGDLLDRVGSNDGTLLNITQGQTGKFDKAYLFDGTSNVSLTNSSTILSTSSFSISMWVKPSNIIGSDRNLLDRTVNIFGLYQIYITNTSGLVWFRIRDDDGAGICVVTSSVGVDTTAWWHIYVERDVVNHKIRIYINAVQRGEEDDLTSGSISMVPKFGLEQGGGAPYIGLMDDVAMWERILSVAEISSIYNGGTGKTIL